MPTKNSFLAGFAFACLLMSCCVVAMGAKGIADRCEPSVTQLAITKSDTVNFTGGLCRSIYVGTGGDVVVVDADGTTATWPSVPSGCIIPAAAIRVNSTSTTASGMVALY